MAMRFSVMLLATLVVALAVWGAAEPLCARSTAGPAVAGEVAAAPAAAPSATEVNKTVRDILSDPRYAPHQGFWQWLRGLLGNWEAPKLPVPGSLGIIVVWVVLVWCVLSLLAILAHLVWSLTQLFGGRRGGSWGAGRSSAGYPGGDRTVDELLALKCQAEAGGRYAEALGLMMLVLLRRLADAGVIEWHDSKTNGDYLSEFRGDRHRRAPFQSFVRDFDGVVYGGSACDAKSYGRLNRQCDELWSHVVTGP
jgi:hypothetical protein